MSQIITRMEIAEITNEVAKGFDYDAVAPEIAVEAQATAARIRDRARASIVETGRDLIAIKTKLGHGHFGPWIAAEFGMTARTAQNYMNAAEVFGAKSEIVSHLPAREVYKLAAPTTPADIREKVIQRFEAGNPIDAREISYLIKVAAQTASEKAKRAKKAEGLPRKKRESREAAWQRALAEDEKRRIEIMNDLARRQAAAAEAFAFLVLHMGDRLPEFIDLLKRADLDTLFGAAAGERLIPIEIPLSLIHESNSESRSAMTSGAIKAAMADIQAGRNNAITVMPQTNFDEDGRPYRGWQVIEGQEVRAAAERLELTTIPAIVRQG